MSDPKEIRQDEARRLLMSCNEEGEGYKPLGLFYLEEDGKFVGIDNSDGNAWTEEFWDKDSCLRWLNGKEEKR